MIADSLTPLPHPRLDELIAVLALLRAEGGCAWDLEQTHESLVKYLIEETYELVDAIESGSREDLLEELGDVLYQVIFHSDIAAATPGEAFSIEDVAAHMSAKMVGRHPHVFNPTMDSAPGGPAALVSADDVVDIWEEMKAVEKSHRTSVLDGIPQGMPALALADKLIGRAQKVGVLESGQTAAIALQDEDQLGALLLAIVSSARGSGLDAERALRMTLRSLQDEIRDVEADLSAVNASPAETSEDPAADADPFDAGIIGFGS